MKFFNQPLVFATLLVAFQTLLPSQSLVQVQAPQKWYHKNLSSYFYPSAQQQEVEQKIRRAAVKENKEMTEDLQHQRTQYIHKVLLDLIPDMPESGPIDIIAAYDHGPAILSLAVFANDQIAAGLFNGDVELFKEGKRAQVLKEHKAPVYFLTWLERDQVLISGSTAYGYPIYNLKVPVPGVYDIESKRQNDRLPTSKQRDERLVVWESESWTPIRIIEPKAQLSTYVAINVVVPVIPDKWFDFFSRRTPTRTLASIIRRRIFLTDPDKQFDSEQPESSETRAALPCKPSTWARVSQRMVYGYQDGSCSRPTSKTTYVTYKNHTAPIRAIQEVGPLLYASASDDGTIAFQSIKAEGQCLAKINLRVHGAIYALALLSANATNHQFVSGSEDGSLHWHII